MNSSSKTLVNIGLFVFAVLIVLIFVDNSKKKSTDCKDDGSCDIVPPPSTSKKNAVKSKPIIISPPATLISDIDDVSSNNTTTEKQNSSDEDPNNTKEQIIVKNPSTLDKDVDLNNPFERNNEMLTADDLLPSTDNEFTRNNNLISPDLRSQNFLTHDNIERYGINTVGSSLRNPSYDIRGTPPNPKIETPWSNSTIDYDANLRHMVITSNNNSMENIQ